MSRDPRDYAPAAIRDAFDYLDDLAPELGLRLGGILGDAAHYADGGYHVPPHACPPGDYSTSQPYDRGAEVDRYAASALDLTPKTAAAMVTITRRLIAATEAGDPRLYPVREFFGTVNGSSVTGRDVPSGRVVTAGPDHLWHEHLSIKRKCTSDAAGLRGVMDVIAGVPYREELIMNSNDEKIVRGIVKDEVRAALRDFTRLDSDKGPTSPGHGIRTLVSDEVRQAIPAIAAATAKATAAAIKTAK